MPNKQEIMAELQRRIQSGHPDAQMIQQHPQFQQAMSQTQGQQMPQVSNNGFPTQTSTYPQTNVPQGMEGRVNPGPQQVPQEAPTQPAQNPNDVGDITSILKRLQPTGGQSLANAMSVLGGGKPVYDPNMAGEFLKTGGALKYAMAPYQQQKLESEVNKNTALIPSSIEQKTEAANLSAERARGLKTSNDVFEGAVNNQGQGQSGGNQFEVASVGPRGMTAKNMTELGHESMVRQGGKGFGIQNQKVDQAIHAQSLINQYQGQAMPQMAYEDLVQTVSNMLSNGTGSAAGDRELLRQQTLYGQTQGTLSYLTGSPHAANSPEVIKVLSDIVGRQGQVSQELRGGYMDNAGKGFGNNFNDYYQPQQSNDVGQMPQAVIQDQNNVNNRAQQMGAPVAGGMFNGEKIRKVTKL